MPKSDTQNYQKFLDKIINNMVAEMNFPAPMSGNLAFVRKKDENKNIWARLQPARIKMPHLSRTVDGVSKQNYIGVIPHNSIVLYVTSLYPDVDQSKQGPYGYVRKPVIYHFVVWNQKPVWISCEDADLEAIK